MTMFRLRLKKLEYSAQQATLAPADLFYGVLWYIAWVIVTGALLRILVSFKRLDFLARERLSPHNFQLVDRPKITIYVYKDEVRHSMLTISTLHKAELHSQPYSLVSGLLIRGWPLWICSNRVVGPILSAIVAVSSHRSE